MNKILVICLLPVILFGCSQNKVLPTGPNLLAWDYADLRLLDPADAVDPDQDLIAVYSRISDMKLQMRVDFLKSGNSFDQTMVIALDTQPGGQTSFRLKNAISTGTSLEWDYLVVIPSTGRIQVLNGKNQETPGINVFVIRNRDQDFLTCEMNVSKLALSPVTSHLQVFSISNNGHAVSDKTAVFSLDDPPPPQARVSFVFWNTLQTSTPAESLRSWAGAHAGPQGSRHGLKYLLDAVRHTRTPIIILDLLQPDNLPVLDYFNALRPVQDLANAGILFLPDLTDDRIIGCCTDQTQLCNFTRARSTIAWSMKLIMLWSENTNLQFNILLDDIFLGGNKFLNNCYNDYAHFEIYPSQTSDFEGYKVALLGNAIQRHSDPLIIGGDFQRSELGNPTIISPLLEYISNHPWIKVESPYDWNYLIVASGPTSPPCFQDIQGPAQPSSSMGASGSFEETTHRIANDIGSLSRTALKDLACTVYTKLINSSDTELRTLKHNYLGQIGNLIQASKWAELPYSTSRCDVDLDYDGKNECVLSNSHLFLSIEPEGGYISFAVEAGAKGVHQIIAPTSELVVGLSDPTEWNLGAGLRSDPAQILGAFADSTKTLLSYVPEIRDGQIILNSPDHSNERSFTLSGTSFLTEIHNRSGASVMYTIPLVLDPWEMYRPGWGDKYFSVVYPDRIQWGIASDISVTVSSNSPSSFSAFNSSRSMLGFPENPNYAYPPGHYLPYPLALIEFHTDKDFSVTFTIDP